MPVTIVRNKVDLSGEAVGLKEENGTTTICLSAQTHQGVDLLREHLANRRWVSKPGWKAVS